MTDKKVTKTEKITLVTCPGCKKKTATFKVIVNKNGDLLGCFGCPKCGGHQFVIGSSRWDELKLKDSYIKNKITDIKNTLVGK